VVFPDLPWLRALAGRCLAKMNREREARVLLDGLTSRRRLEYVDSYAMALFRQSLGDDAGAFAELDRASAERCVSLYAIDVDPKADSLRQDRRFQRFRRQRQVRRPVVVRSTTHH
jgi:hypothetical protein